MLGFRVEILGFESGELSWDSCDGMTEGLGEK